MFTSYGKFHDFLTPSYDLNQYSDMERNVNIKLRMENIPLHLSTSVMITSLPSDEVFKRNERIYTIHEGKIE
ncbi:hypothetical protein T11_17821 [Trichinella zimbabwensis]|uniref:Uncharacterized protein n=1 Tax=Trichinella zimbabwensis TaxID=268475 RepID=A0A0V1HJY0_9BILA|nr:hypothetical protein T11_17821 [Trichinella zimbabwensis]